jgi:adenosylcobinamide-GDP ribazoletransferase
VLSAVAFLTVVGRGRAPDAGTLRWFPVVGAAMGGLLAGVWWAASELWGPALAAAVVVAADLALTGLLHLDGLADSADGLLPHLDREQRLSVMRQPDVGAFALGVVPAVLLVRWAALADATATAAELSLVAVWCASRTLVAAIPAFVPYARPEGLTTGLLGGASPWLAMWLLPCVVGLAASEGLAGWFAVPVAVAAAAAVVQLARRRLGGYTGDVLGAIVLLSETAALTILALRS